MKNIIVLYDGVCLFCEGWVNFVINKKTESSNIFFIPLSKVKLEKKANDYVMSMGGDSDSIFCITENGDFFIKSDASLRVMTNLRIPFSLIAQVLLFIPRFLRNYVYDQIGKRRYKIWGKKEVCVLPEGSSRKFFVDGVDEMPEQFCEIYKEIFNFIE